MPSVPSTNSELLQLFAGSHSPSVALIYGFEAQLRRSSALLNLEARITGESRILLRRGFQFADIEGDQCATNHVPALERRIWDQHSVFFVRTG